MKTVDYSWVWAIVIVVGLVVFWKPLMGAIQNLTGGTNRKAQIAAGKVIFYDTQRWGGKDTYKSCAMCHAADFTPDPNKKITRADYKPGKPVSLEGSSKRLMNVMGDDALFTEINDCIGLPSRLNAGKVSVKAGFIPPLIAYIKSL